MKSGQKGVTMIELLVVMVIVGILAAIAIPTYRAYVIRSNRSEAKTALLATAQNLERCYTNSTPYAYNSATCTAAVTLPLTIAGGNYVISAGAVADAATMYTLVATPQGAQTADTQCASFSLTQAGIQTVTGTYSATPLECWRR